MNGYFLTEGIQGHVFSTFSAALVAWLPLGMAKEEVQDITYATPMERLMRDIGVAGFEVSDI